MIKTTQGPKTSLRSRRQRSNQTSRRAAVGFAAACCLGFEKPSSWCERQSKDGEGTCREGKTIKERCTARRGGWIKPPAEPGMPEKAYELAEKWQDHRTLVEHCSGGDLQIGIGRYTKPCLPSSQSHREDLHRHRRRCTDQPREIRGLHTRRQGASQLSLALGTRLCPGCGGEGDGRGGSCRPARIRAAFSLLFTTEISLEIETNLGKVTGHEDKTPDEMD